MHNLWSSVKFVFKTLIKTLNKTGSRGFDAVRTWNELSVLT